MNQRALDSARTTSIALTLISLLNICSSFCLADRPTSTVPESGVRDRAPDVWALTNATIVTHPGHSIEDANLVIRRGIIVDVGQSIDVPADARIVDMSGKTIYAGLVESWSEITVNQPAARTAHWNPHVRPERSAADAWDSKGNESLRKAGFALRLIVPDAGVLRGTSAVVTTGDTHPANSIVATGVAQHLRLTSPRGANRKQYPNSPMGAVALARQTFYDARWYDSAWRAFHNGSGIQRPESNITLETLSKAISNDALFVFDAPDEQYALRANRFAVEFGLNRVVIRGSGREYQRLDEIASHNRSLIVPIDFPKPPNVATAEAANNANLSELMHWHFAPENPARLRSTGANIALTSHGIENKEDFRKHVRKAVERGLSPADALAACTTVPAELFGIAATSGTIAKGKAAHLMICDGDWLDEKSKVAETWVDGVRFQHKNPPIGDLSGKWKLALNGPADRETLYLSLERDKDKVSGTVATTQEETENDEEQGDDDEEEEEEEEEADEDHVTSTKLKNVDSAFGRITGSFSAEIWESTGTVRLTATQLDDDDEQLLIGSILDENGNVTSFKAERLESDEAADDDDEQLDDDAEHSEEEDHESEASASDRSDALEIDVNYPLGAYGVKEPHSESDFVIIQNATIWTCGPAGVIQNGSILIRDGQIVEVGDDVDIPAGARQINAKGKHITPGIIDCHSHMATDGGVNESTQAITAEVRIGDFIDATDISIWRQLAGGVTTANILHGSANPIGGQNQVIKLRWGRTPEELKFGEAPQGIKFALGENVKQSNWGDDYTSRYPQSRLGVEQIMRDALLAAKEYQRQWDEWNSNGKGLPPRKDLELDALLEIVHGDRWIHCHSYRQDEILALIRTLDSFDITIGTFQHILEGYKVAKEMAEHGAMGSSFSDWWAYKFEVIDAIPYNGALMHKAGVVVSFNSDDAELARHLNHEAAKAVKYGKVPPEEALKFVTLNPAKQLRIDEHVGSLEPGKHADLVVWSGDPLQITSRCEQTWIEGHRYFDINEEKLKREADAKLHDQLVRQILDSGEAMKKPGEHEELLRHLFPRHDEYCHGHGHEAHGH